MSQPVEQGGNKDRLVSFIVQNFYKFVNNPSENDTKSMLMLIAALTVLNTPGDSTTNLSAAKRLAQSALARRIKK